MNKSIRSIMPAQYQIALKTSVHLLCIAPLIALLATLTLQGADALGANPVESLQHFSGSWSLRYLWLCLALTPLRNLSGWQWPILIRRTIGLYAFAYSCTHLLLFLLFDLTLNPALLWQEIRKRPYITIGFMAWLLLLPLAITSTKAWQRRLKRHWKALQRLIYPAAVLVVIHFALQPKSFDPEPLVYAALLVGLLALRIKMIYQPLRRAIAASKAKLG